MDDCCKPAAAFDEGAVKRHKDIHLANAFDSLDKLYLLQTSTREFKKKHNTLPHRSGLTLWTSESAHVETQAWELDEGHLETEINSCSPCFDKPGKETNRETKTM